MGMGDFLNDPGLVTLVQEIRARFALLKKGVPGGIAELDSSGLLATDQKPTYTADEVGAIPLSQKGANSGVAELDASGKVPSSQLPSYVDDVLEYDAYASFPSSGETGKIYIDKSTNLQYRWSGTQYINLNPASGSVSSVATGDGLTGGPVTSTGTIKANLKSYVKTGNVSISGGSKSGFEYSVGLDKDGYLEVCVPWKNITEGYTDITSASEKNLNNYVTPGLYTASVSASPKFTNTPTAPNEASFNLIVISVYNTSSQIKQIYFQHYSKSIWVRSTDNTGSSWTTWVDITQTYSVETAASGGTTPSLVTTGEKFIWNNNSGTVTSVATGAGLTGGPVTSSGTIKVDLKSETPSTLEAASKSSTSGKEYAVGLDKNGNLSVNIPWTDTTYESKTAAQGGTDVSLVTTGEKYTWNNKGTVTSVAPGVGLAGNTVTGSGTIKAHLKSETASTLTAASKGSTANREYAVGVDANGDLSVNVPWEASSGGHTIKNESGTALTQRTNLQVENGYLEDDSTNNATVIKDNKYHGTKAAWDQLSSAQKAKYKYYEFTDDFNGMTIDTTPTSGSTNPVTSGGVYSYIDEMIIQAINAEY